MLAALRLSSMYTMSSAPAEIADSDYISVVKVPFNNSVKLHCPAGGLPRPRVSWYFDDTLLSAVDNATDGIYLLEDGWTLYIEVAQLSHAGRYWCRAVNDAGHDEKLFNLTVLGQSVVCWPSTFIRHYI